MSLVAATEEGFPTKEDYLFDVASRLEMRGYKVRFLSTQDLHDLQNDFIKSNPDREPGSESGSESEPGSGIESETGSFDIYRLLQFLVEDNPNSSFFIDELPFIFEGECYISVSTIV